MKIDVLGTKYAIVERLESVDPLLKKCDGYCDKTIRLIVVAGQGPEVELGDYEVHRRKVLRHEIIHAFLFESGLQENWKHDEWGHDETCVDWIATQFPKLVKAFETAGCLD